MVVKDFEDKRTLLQIKGLNKKFCNDILYNMRYGIRDIFNIVLGKSKAGQELRPKEFWVLKDINLTLFEGEILGIVGANGSGKTSLMRVVGNIYPNDEGEIAIREGLKITGVFALNSGMQPLYTGRENIYLKGAMYGLSKEEIEERMDFIISFSELGENVDQAFGNYSSGMRARLAYAIALATEPDVFILDEALAVGDSVFKTKCFEHLKLWAKQPGKGVLFVSNNIRKILKVATRTLVMDKGEIILDSPDIHEALHFYIENCLKHLDEKTKQKKIKRVKEYDF